MTEGMLPTGDDANWTEVTETEIHVAQIRLSSMSSFAVSAQFGISQLGGDT